MALYRIFAGKKTGKGSTDKEGFSSNGEFFRNLAKNKEESQEIFKVTHKGYKIYSIRRY